MRAWHLFPSPHCENAPKLVPGEPGTYFPFMDPAAEFRKAHAAQRRARAQTGEDAAAAYLTAHGYRILERNLRVGHDEADLVALTTHGSVAIIEVKTRHGDWHGEDRVDSTKRQRLLRLAAALTQDARFRTRLFQFDVISVQLEDARDPIVHHFPHAFDASGTHF